jgi:hypothetical protein
MRPSNARAEEVRQLRDVPELAYLVKLRDATGSRSPLLPERSARRLERCDAWRRLERVSAWRRWLRVAERRVLREREESSLLSENMAGFSLVGMWLGAAVAAETELQSATPSATVRSRFMMCSPTLQIEGVMPGGSALRARARRRFPAQRRMV